MIMCLTNIFIQRSLWWLFLSLWWLCLTFFDDFFPSLWWLCFCPTNICCENFINKHFWIIKYVWKFYVTFVQLYLWIMCEIFVWYLCWYLIFVWYLFKCTWVKCIPLICPLCTLQRIIYGAIFSEYCHINYPQMKQTGSKGRLKIQIQI